MDVFGVLVSGRGAERLYPRGTVLICASLANWGGVLRSGHRIVLQHVRADGLVEVTVRELEVDDSVAWLWARTDFAPCGPVQAPWPICGYSWKRGESLFAIAGIVLASLQPEAYS
jgi:hypothetical protein